MPRRPAQPHSSTYATRLDARVEARTSVHGKNATPVFVVQLACLLPPTVYLALEKGFARGVGAPGPVPAVSDSCPLLRDRAMT